MRAMLNTSGSTGSLCTCCIGSSAVLFWGVGESTGTCRCTCKVTRPSGLLPPDAMLDELLAKACSEPAWPASVMLRMHLLCSMPLLPLSGPGCSPACGQHAQPQHQGSPAHALCERSGTNVRQALILYCCSHYPLSFRDAFMCSAEAGAHVKPVQSS